MSPPERTPAGAGAAGEAAGAAIVHADLAGTAVLAAAGVAGAAAPDQLEVVTAAVSVGLFAVGVATFLWGYAVGVARSRDDAVTVPGLFFVTGTGPEGVRRRLRGALGVQVVVAFAVAAIRPYTSVAFVVLAPLFGLGLMALWCARHGTFPPREPKAPATGRGAGTRT